MDGYLSTMDTPPTKILLVDDEHHTITCVSLALGPAYQVDHVSDSRKAFEILKENTPGFEIIITDHMMPGWVGWELLKNLERTAFRGKSIVLSAFLSAPVEAIYRGLGVEHLIPKPFDLSQLREAVAASVRAIRAAGS
jgi:DNA-binding response OmpR family regulator